MAPSSTPASSSALRSQPNERAHAWQASVSSRARTSSVSSSSAPISACPKSATFPTSQPVRPGTTESRTPGTSSAAVGTPCAAASMIDRPQPSASEVLVVNQARSSRASRAWSGWKPWKVTTSASPSSAERPSSRARSGPLPTMSTRSRGTACATGTSWPSSRSTRLCGTSLLTTAIVGSGSRGARIGGVASRPLGTTWIGPRIRSLRRTPSRVDGETATTGRPRYTARLTGPSRNRPTAASTGPNRVANCSWWMWCTTCTMGLARSTNSGAKNGIPFWQSTR